VFFLTSNWFRGVVLATYLLVSMFGLHLHKLTGCHLSGCDSQPFPGAVCTHDDEPLVAGQSQSAGHPHSAGHRHTGHHHHCADEGVPPCEESVVLCPSTAKDQVGQLRSIDTPIGQKPCQWRGGHSEHCSVCDQLWSISQYGFALFGSIAVITLEAVSYSPLETPADSKTAHIEPASRGPPACLSA